VPFAGVGCVKIPEEVGDDDAILLSDIFPTAYFGAELAEVCDGNTVAIFGCGPVGLFAIISAQLRGAGRIFAIDTIESRLDKARELGAEVIDFNSEDPIEAIKEATGNIGVDRVIDAVGVDAVAPKKGPASRNLKDRKEKFAQERKKVAPKTRPKGGNWEPGDAPSMAIEWALEAVAKAGTLGIIGVYSEMVEFPLGSAMEKNLTLKMGNCNHRRYIPKLVELVRSGAVRPSEILSHRQPLGNVIEAYKAFDKREPGWIKVELEPEREAA
jgi:threonine dehydrogenase-like Zn-dependent dehydrogenase